MAKYNQNVVKTGEKGVFLKKMDRKVFTNCWLSWKKKMW